MERKDFYNLVCFHLFKSLERLWVSGCGHKNSSINLRKVNFQLWAHFVGFSNKGRKCYKLHYMMMLLFHVDKNVNNFIRLAKSYKVSHFKCDWRIHLYLICLQLVKDLCYCVIVLHKLHLICCIYWLCVTVFYNTGGSSGSGVNLS